MISRAHIQILLFLATHTLFNTYAASTDFDTKLKTLQHTLTLLTEKLPIMIEETEAKTQEQEFLQALDNLIEQATDNATHLNSVALRAMYLNAEYEQMLYHLITLCVKQEKLQDTVLNYMTQKDPDTASVRAQKRKQLKDLINKIIQKRDQPAKA